MCRSCQVERFKRRVDADTMGREFDPVKVEAATREPNEEDIVICYYCGKNLEGQYHGDIPVCGECTAKHEVIEGYNDGQ